ncbi:hypothetical protein ACTQ6A_00060 [Lachnospiraceae bacterium LCP25S3_G4]
MDLEVIGTSAVKEAIAMTDYLSPYVNDKDKEPLWDGHIYVYSKTSKKNKDFIGRAPVQVKGKDVNKLSTQKITYPVPVVNLKKYRMDGGILYFVVQVDAYKNKKIFYSALLPFEINKLVEKAEKKNTISITLYEFPNETNEITNIVMNFVKDRDKQVLLRNGKNISIEEFLKQGDPAKISFGFSYTGFGYDRTKPFEYLFKHDVYMYAENKEMNIRIPIDHMWRAEIAKMQLSGAVCIGDKEYYKEYDVIHKVDCDELHIGKSIIFNLVQNGTPKVNYCLRGNLKERIIAEKFIIDLMKEKQVTVNGAKLEINATEKEIKAFCLEDIENHLRHLQRVQDVLDILDVTVPLECEGLTEKDEEYIRMLIMAFKHKRTIGFNEGEIPPIAHITINNLHIMLHFKVQNDGKYLLESFTDCVAEWSSDYNDGTMFPTSKYTILTENDFLIISNLNYDSIVKDIMSFENDGHYNRCNLTMLEILKAYDKEKKPELLEIATQICRWLVEKENKSEIAILNLYQCYFRSRKLEQDEENILLDFIEVNNDNYAIIAGSYILLEDFKMVSRYMDKMKREERKSFESFPIFSLMKKSARHADLDKLPNEGE